MKIAILYDVLDREGTAWRVGGIQTYARHLAMVCSAAGWETAVFQPASREFETSVGTIRVRGVLASTPEDGRAYAQAVLPAVRRWAEKDSVLIVFGQMHMAVNVPWARTIGIQHGIYWDLDYGETQTPWVVTPGLAKALPENRIREAVGRLMRRTLIGRWRIEAHTLRQLRSCAAGYDEVDVRVCVDHNFSNWHRTLFRPRSSKPPYVIINPAEVATPEQLASRQVEPGVIRVIYARRFVWYRGTGIMATVGKRLLAERPDVRLCFAGEGPDGDSLKEFFGINPRVRFVTYAPDEALETHLAHDVAVNASLGSEGSSLSVGEAMGAGCAVVATAVGGVTNMVIDGFNGLLVNPNAESLYQGLTRVVTDDDLRTRLGQRAWQTAGAAFSMDSWGRQWRAVIREAEEYERCRLA